MPKIYNRGLAALQSRFILWHTTAEILNGATITRTISSAQAFCFYAFQNPATQSDSWRHKLWMRAGTYTFRYLYVKSSNGGQLQINLYNAADAAMMIYSPSFFEHYAASITVNQEFVDTAVTVPRDGLHYLRGDIAGKLPASSGYLAFITMIELYRTGD